MIKSDYMHICLRIRMQTIQQENAEKEIVLANLIRVRTTANIVHLRDTVRSIQQVNTLHISILSF